MEYSNELQVAFGHLKTKTTADLYRLDEDQYLVFTDIDLPEYFRTDFGLSENGYTVSMTGYNNKVLIPDELLIHPGIVHAWIWANTGISGGKTIYHAIIPVIARGSRNDVSPDPADQQQIDALIGALNDGVERAEAAASLLENVSAEATTLSPEEDATAHYADGVFTFGIPRGPQGIQGPKGDPGIIYTLEPEVSAIIYDPESSSFAPAIFSVLAWKVREGILIAPGSGWQVTINVVNAGGSVVATETTELEDEINIASITLPSSLSSGYTVTATLAEVDAPDYACKIEVPVISNGAKGNTGATGPQGPQGIQGETGATPAFAIGSVITGAAGSSAQASITGTAEEPVLNLTIPQGLKGDPGNGDMIADDFSTSKSYTAGEYAIYNGSLYRFTAAHAAGAWIGTDATAVQLGEDVVDLKNALNKNVEDMYDTLEQEFGASNKTLTGKIIYTFSDNERKLISAISSQNTVKYYGKNIFDQNTRVAGKIKNDSGEEVNDSNSSYFSQYIPCSGKIIKPNFQIQRIYRFDSNKDLIERTYHNSDNSYTVPSGTYFIQIQIDNAYLTDSMALWFGTTEPTYAPYQESSNYRDIIGDINAVYDGVSAFSLTVYELDKLDETIEETTLNTIESIFGTLTFSETNYVISLDGETCRKIINIDSESSLTFISKNIFDQSTKVPGKIKNDSGAEVSDGGSCYYSQYIPCHGKSIKANFVLQRLYFFDENNTFLRRTTTPSGTDTSAIIPDDTYFIQIQIDKNNATESMAVWFGDETPTYSAYRQSSVFSGFDDGVNIIGTGAEQITVSFEMINAATIESHIIPAVSSYGMWEPETVTDDYKYTPLGQSSQSIPALTSLGWRGFLADYFDTYLHEYDDGYQVYREDLGLDSGAQATGNIASPIYSYTFQPKYYNKTVLLSGGMNTCEASTYFGIAYFIDALMEHTEPGMLALYNSTRFVVIPVICPSGISYNPLLYPNSNGVRINKNFEYYGSWARFQQQDPVTAGPYPDSEVETKALKYWLNKYRGATFWLDCHSDTGTHAVMKHLGTVFCSDSDTATKFTANKQSIIDYYINKGYISASDTVSLGFYSHSAQYAEYPKTQYAKEVCDIPAAMMEQFEYSTAYGSDGDTNNDSYAIKHYVAMIRYMVLIMCKSNAEIVT